MPDADKLSFPLRLVIQVIAIVATLLGTTYGLRSDVRDILTRQSAADRLADERAAALIKTIDAITRQQALQQIDITNIKIALAQSGVKFREN